MRDSLITPPDVPTPFQRLRRSSAALPVAVTAAVLTMLVVRSTQFIASSSMWSDEAFSIRVARAGWSEWLTLTRTDSGNMIGYNALIRALDLVWPGSRVPLWWFEWPSVAATLGAVIIVAILAIRRLSPIVGAAVVLAVGMAPMTLQLATDVRSYSFVLLWSAWSTFELDRSLHRRDDIHAARRALLVTAVGPLLQTLAIVPAVMFACAIVIVHRRRLQQLLVPIAALGATTATVAGFGITNPQGSGQLAWLPPTSVPTTAYQAMQRFVEWGVLPFGSPAPRFLNITIWTIALGILSLLAIGQIPSPKPGGRSVPVTPARAAAALRTPDPSSRAVSLALAVAIMATAGLMFAMSVRTAGLLSNERYLMTLAPMIAFLTGTGLDRLPLRQLLTRRSTRWAVLLVAGGVAWGAVHQVNAARRIQPSSSIGPQVATALRAIEASTTGTLFVTSPGIERGVFDMTAAISDNPVIPTAAVTLADAPRCLVGPVTVADPTTATIDWIPTTLREGDRWAWIRSGQDGCHIDLVDRVARARGWTSSAEQRLGVSLGRESALVVFTAAGRSTEERGAR